MESNKRNDEPGCKSATLSARVLRDIGTHRASSTIAVSLPTPSTNNSYKPLSSDNISAIHDALCPQADAHAMGVICQTCRTILMPWLDTLPQFVVDEEVLEKGPRGSIVRGVLLQNPEAVAVLTVVASLEITSKRYDEVDGLVEIMQYYRKAAAAGMRVADIHRVLLRVSSPAHDLPAIADTINTALKNPMLTAEEYTANVKVELAAVAPLRPTYGRSPLLFPARAVGRSLERNMSPQENSASNDRVPTFGESKRPVVRGTDSHAPPKEKGPWEFVPGSIITKAIVGEPEPHKYFLVRQSIDDPAKKDVRQYPSWETMDWNEPRDIAKFNKWQQQIKDRVADTPAALPRVWTQAEKDVLKHAIEAALARGLTRNNINWDEIAQSLSDHFAEKTQYAGEPLAQATKLKNDDTITAPHHKQPKKLKEDRVGRVVRSGTAVRSQARKYGDIDLLLRLSKNSKLHGSRDDAGNYDADITEDDDASILPDYMDGETGNNAHGGCYENLGLKAAKPTMRAKSAKGTKRRRSRSPDASSKRPKAPPKPSPTSAESFANEVAKISPWFKRKVTKPTPSSEPLDGDFV